MANTSARKQPRLKPGYVATMLLAALCLVGTFTLFTQGSPREATSAGPRHAALDPETESRGPLAEMVPAALEEGAALQLQDRGKPSEKPKKNVLRLR